MSQPVSAAESHVASLPPHLKRYAQALSFLPPLGFSTTAALHACGIRPRQAAQLAGLAESVVGSETGAPQVSQAALHALDAALEQLISLGILEKQDERYRMPARFRTLLCTDAPASTIQGDIILGYVDWMEKNRADASLMLAEESGWRLALDYSLSLPNLEAAAYLIGWTCAPGGYFHRRREHHVRLKLFQRIIPLLQQRRDTQAAWLFFLYASVLRQLNELEQAESALRHSITLADELDAIHEGGMARGELAAICMQRHRFEEAMTLYEEKMAAMQRVHDPAEFAETIGELAEALVVQQRHAEALDLMEQRLGLLQSLGDSRGACLSRLALGDVLAELLRFEEAVANYRLAMPILEALDPRNAAVAYANLGLYLSRQGKKEEALQTLELATTHFERLKLHPQAQEVRQLMAELKV